MSRLKTITLLTLLVTLTCTQIINARTFSGNTSDNENTLKNELTVDKTPWPVNVTWNVGDQTICPGAWLHCKQLEEEVMTLL
jgi:hypothetical protein